MGALSPMHLALVLVIALLVFGPKKLPEIGKELGKAIREFKRASRDVMDSFHEALEDRPVSTYEPPALSAYHAPEDTFHQAAQASSLGEATAPEAPATPAAAPAGTVERPPHSTGAPMVDKPATPEMAPAPAGRGAVDADPGHGGTGQKSGDDTGRKVGAAIDSRDQSSHSGQDAAKALERTA